MKKYNGFIFGSRTYDAAALIGLVGVIELNAHLIQQYAADQFGLIMFGLAVLKWFLRSKTTGPVGDK